MIIALKRTAFELEAFETERRTDGGTPASAKSLSLRASTFVAESYSNTLSIGFRQFTGHNLQCTLYIIKDADMGRYNVDVL